MAYHVGRCCTDEVWGRRCVFGYSSLNVLSGHAGWIPHKESDPWSRRLRISAKQREGLIDMDGCMWCSLLKVECEEPLKSVVKIDEEANNELMTKGVR
jgi:hypothetical protein